LLLDYLCDGFNVVWAFLSETLKIAFFDKSWERQFSRLLLDGGQRVEVFVVNAWPLGYLHLSMG